MKNAVLWDVRPCASCKNRSFGGTYRLHHQGEKNLRASNNVSRIKQPKHASKKYDASREALVWNTSYIYEPRGPRCAPPFLFSISSDRCHYNCKGAMALRRAEVQTTFSFLWVHSEFECRTAISSCSGSCDGRNVTLRLHYHTLHGMSHNKEIHLDDGSGRMKQKKLCGFQSTSELYRPLAAACLWM
jgi:hypothetical protein